jgi:hypothetical protein
MSTHHLATFNARRLEGFLTELLNLRWEAKAISRFAQRFALDFGLFDSRFLSSLLVKGVARQSIEEDGQLIIGYFHLMFRAAWLEPRAKTRDWAWAVFRVELARTTPLGGKYLSLTDENGQFRFPEPPQELPIEKAFDYLLTHHKRARYCPNHDCPAPYFFAGRQSQRYCSESCAQASERENKRRWWAEHGSALRKQQSQGMASKQIKKKAGEKGRKGIRHGAKTDPN